MRAAGGVGEGVPRPGQYGLDCGLSQEAFGDVVGVYRTYMGGLERGERNLTLPSLERLATTIKVDPLDLLRA